jgi:hypothetical protein
MYRIDAAGVTVASVQSSTPAQALRDYFTDRLASQDGRYGRLHDGTPVVALTSAWTRAHYEDHGTTRV